MMKLITFEDIRKLNIKPGLSYSWIDFVLRNRDKFVLPTKIRIPLEASDYCNVMPCSMPEENFFGLKVINRSKKRREENDALNLDSQILLYDYETANLKAILDGNLITTLRTAAVAVHSIINFVRNYETLAMLGLGNIGVTIGEMLFELSGDKQVMIKLFKYKDHAERFIERFSKHENIRFVVCDDYDSLMKDSDVIVSSVTYAEDDFCAPSVYKKGCTIIPVHMRGFMKCDLEFDNIVVSDMVRANGFKYYESFKRISYTDDILKGEKEVRESPDDRVLIYNLGLAMTDLYFAEKIYHMVDKSEICDLRPIKNFYV